MTDNYESIKLSTFISIYYPMPLRKSYLANNEREKWGSLHLPLQFKNGYLEVETMSFFKGHLLKLASQPATCLTFILCSEVVYLDGQMS